MRWAMSENDCGKSIHMSDVFLPYYWGSDNDCYYPTIDTKQFFTYLNKPWLCNIITLPLQ